MRFSIVTPSFRQLGWLKRCARSIADQQGVEVEHIIQDAGTGPELNAWVVSQTQARLYAENDQGMYDAVNRGMDRATGEILGYLNCDEQYLPGALEAVSRVFDEHPETDIVVGDFLIVNPGGQLLCFRRVTPLRRLFLETDHLYAYTCATFYRRRVREAGVRYRTDLKAASDGQFLIDALARGFKPRNLRRYLATFTHTGENLGHGSVAYAERDGWLAALPRWKRVLTPLFRRARQFEKLLAGGYSSPPIEYAIYTGDDARQRSHIRCDKPQSTYRTELPS